MPGENDHTSGMVAPHGDHELRAWSEGKLPGTKAGGEGGRTLEQSVLWETRSSHAHSSRRVSMVGTGQSTAAATAGRPAKEARPLRTEFRGGRTPRAVQKPC